MNDDFGKVLAGISHSFITGGKIPSGTYEALLKFEIEGENVYAPLSFTRCSEVLEEYLAYMVDYFVGLEEKSEEKKLIQKTKTWCSYFQKIKEKLVQKGVYSEAEMPQQRFRAPPDDPIAKVLHGESFVRGEKYHARVKMPDGYGFFGYREVNSPIGRIFSEMNRILTKRLVDSVDWKMKEG